MSHIDKFQNYFADLPKGVAALCKVLQGLVLHFLDAKEMGHVIPVERLSEINLKYTEKIIEKIIFLDSCSLLQERDISKKFIGSCRDFSLLLCTMLRHQNIPARLRFGFSTFYFREHHHDQVLLEYWNTSKETWCLVNARTNAVFVEKNKISESFDSCDLPHYSFYTASRAWRLCRAGKKSAHQFGAGKASSVSGWWYLRNKLIQDLAALNKMEMLSWDAWGMMLQGQSDNFMNDATQVALLDELAEVILSDDLQKVKDFYEMQKELVVPEEVVCHRWF